MFDFIALGILHIFQFVPTRSRAFFPSNKQVAWLQFFANVFELPAEIRVTYAA
jgi:hypothetical protein